MINRERVEPRRLKDNPGDQGRRVFEGNKTEGYIPRYIPTIYPENDLRRKERC
jgi:hypothetical protein